jgi:serine/threonine-protein kinase RsbW
VLAEEIADVPAVAEELGVLHAALDRFWGVLDRTLPRPPSQDWRVRFATALAEIAANIIRHAYPAGTDRRPLRLRLRLYEDRLVATFTDRGISFAPPDPPGSTPDLTELREGGYGLALARAGLDRLDYRRTTAGTNCWRLMKRFDAAEPDVGLRPMVDG